MKFLKSYGAWIYSIFMILAAVGGFFSGSILGFCSGIFLLFAGILFFPPAKKYWQQYRIGKTVYRVILSVLLLYIGALIMPAQKTEAPAEQSIQQTTVLPETFVSENNALLRTTPALAESLSEETTTIAETTQKEVIVHITKTGSKYHSSGCQYLRKSDITVTLAQAKNKDLTPCSKCNPPR